MRIGFDARVQDFKVFRFCWLYRVWLQECRFGYMVQKGGPLGIPSDIYIQYIDICISYMGDPQFGIMSGPC